MVIMINVPCNELVAYIQDCVLINAPVAKQYRSISVINKLGLWNTAKVYMEINGRSHEFILLHNNGYVTILDTFYNHRQLRHKTWPLSEFYALIHKLFNDSVVWEKHNALIEFIDPPSEYILAWNGVFNKEYICVLN